MVVDWEREKNPQQEYNSNAPVEGQNANRHNNHGQNARCHFVQNMHGVVLQIIQVRGHGGGQLAHAVVVKKAHRYIAEPVAQGDSFPCHKFKSCGTLQAIHEIFENAAQHKSSYNQDKNDTPSLAGNFKATL